jgi:uncharacterized phage protein gp47/JayE
MSTATDLTRWNRAGLSRFRYVDGNAVTFLEQLRLLLIEKFSDADAKTLQWEDLVARRSPDDSDDVWVRLQQEQARLKLEKPGETNARLLAQYRGEPGDGAWELARVLARASHVLTGHLDAYANEGFLGTATQWDNVRRLVEMLDYHPAPPASASTRLVIEAKTGASGTVSAGFAVAYNPADGSAPVVFETLEDLTVDAKLNALRPAEYDRSQEPLGESTLLLDGAADDLKAGEPLVLLDSEGVLRAHLITGIQTLNGTTEVQVTPRLSRRLLKGYTEIHVKPAERLQPSGPAAKGATIARGLHLTEEPTGLLPGKIVWISDGVAKLFRRVVAVQGKQIVLADDVGNLRVDSAEVAYPVDITVVAQEERPIAKHDAELKGEIYALRVVGDWSRLTNQLVADKAVDAQGNRRLPFYRVTAARYHPADSGDAAKGHTILTVTWNQDDHAFPLKNPQALLAPPAGAGLWKTDSYLEKQAGHLPAAIVTGQSKKAGAGDLAVVVSGSQMAWTRLGSVAVDADRKESTLTAATGWSDRGGGDYFLAGSTVYTHFKSVLHVVGWQENRERLSGCRIPLKDPPEALEKGRTLLVERTDDATAAFFTHVERLEGSTLILHDELPEGFRRGNTTIAGNVALAGHGETRSEKVLGSGDATLVNQSFVFAEAGVSFVSDPTQPAGVSAAIALTVGGRTWTQVGTLADSGPADPHFIVRMTEEGYLSISFGDGAHGRRLPTGVNNLKIKFRKGAGLAGNLAAGSLTKPVKPHRLVEKVRQPLIAAGGNDMEDVESLRENAPATLLTLERAVSLEDFGWLAAKQSSVWQARAFLRPAGIGRNERVEVVVVPAGGGELGTLAATLTEFLLDHAVPEVQITVSRFTPQSFTLDLRLDVNAAGYNPDTVVAAVRTALESAFSLKRRKLGQDVFLSEVYKVVEGTTGVEHSVAVLNGDASKPRAEADERGVLTLGRLTIQVSGATAAAAPGGAAGAPSRTIGKRDIVIVQGIGAAYAGALRQAGIRTLDDLQRLDPRKTAVKIGAQRLWEFKAKAEIILGLAADATRLGAVLDRFLGALVNDSSSALAQLTGEPASSMDALKENLRLLQIALDDEIFRSLTLRELLSEQK